MNYRPSDHLILFVRMRFQLLAQIYLRTFQVNCRGSTIHVPKRVLQGNRQID